MASRISGGWIHGVTPRRADADGARPARFDVAERTQTDVKEASDVVALPGGRFLVVGDRSRKVAVVSADGSVKKVELPGLGDGPSQFEGLAYDPVRKHLLVSREESREILRYEWNPAKKGDKPKLEKRFDVSHLDGPSNKGVEGLAYLSGSQSPTGRPQLLGVKEGHPRELVLFNDGGGGRPMPVRLDPAVKELCKDFSAVAVDPKTGNVYIASDESSDVVQLRLVRDGDQVRGRLVQAIPLRGKHGEPLARVEGISFNEKGDLFVLTESDGVLRRLARR